MYMYMSNTSSHLCLCIVSKYIDTQIYTAVCSGHIENIARCDAVDVVLRSRGAQRCYRKKKKHGCACVLNAIARAHV